MLVLGSSFRCIYFRKALYRFYEPFGPDIVNSMDPNAAKELVEGTKLIKKHRGGKKGPVKEEKPVIDFAYASVVSIKQIEVGEALTKENIWVKRPGTGPFFAEDYNKILGKLAFRQIKCDSHIQKEDIYDA